MSQAKAPKKTDDDEQSTVRLTDEEREVFERLAEEFGDEDVGRLFESVLQSSETVTESEEASS